MWPELKAAAAKGVLLGVTYGVAAILILVAVSWLLGDYRQVRAGAAEGHAAFEYLGKVQAAQQAAQQQRRPATAPAPEAK